MARWFMTGVACSIQINFLKDGEFVIPDSGSVFATVRKADGTPLAGYDSLALPATSTDYLLNISASVNTVDSGSTIEGRFVEVKYLSGGTPLFFRQNYLLSPFVPLTATHDDVRSALGLRSGEVKEEEIDLLSAYYSLVRSNSGLSSALTAPDDRSMYANEAVTLKAALALVPSLQLRAVKEDTLNNASLIRSSVDYEVLAQSLSDRLSVALGNALSVTEPALVLVDIFQVTSPTDPVTNT